MTEQSTAIQKAQEQDFSATKSNLNIVVSSTPPHLRITQTMVETLITEPALAAEFFFNLKLDAFQKSRLKWSWWTPNVIDSSGFSSAKTFNLWMVAALRCLLMPEHIAAVYYPTFGSGQKIFWQYFEKVAGASPIFRANIGKRTIEGLDSETSDRNSKASHKGASCWTLNYKNGAALWLPAGNFNLDASGQAGLRFNFLGIDEWTKIKNTGSTGIEDQLIGRTTRENFNKNHPLWCNHFLFLATAEDTMHPAYEMYQEYLAEVKKGNPEYACLSYCYKDYSDLPYKNGISFKDVFRQEKVIETLRKGKSAAGFRQEGLGLWSANGKGLYTKTGIDACYATGRERKLVPMASLWDDEAMSDDSRRLKVHYFLGVDIARSETHKADDGALVAIRAEPRVENPGNNVRDWRIDCVYAYKVRNHDVGQWSALIHRKEIHFGFSRIQMDPGGGGNWVRPELKKHKQIIRDVEQKVKPIACLEDEPDLINGKFILSMFRWSDKRVDDLWKHHNLRHQDNLNDLAHQDLYEAISSGLIGFPENFKARDSKEIEKWGGENSERAWANTLIDLTARQLQAISVVMNDDNTVYHTSHGARKFVAKGKKDFAYALMYAYVAFLSWLKTYESEGEIPDEDADMAG